MEEGTKILHLWIRVHRTRLFYPIFFCWITFLCFNHLTTFLFLLNNLIDFIRMLINYLCKSKYFKTVNFYFVNVKNKSIIVSC